SYIMHAISDVIVFYKKRTKQHIFDFSTFFCLYNCELNILIMIQYMINFPLLNSSSTPFKMMFASSKYSFVDVPLSTPIVLTPFLIPNRSEEHTSELQSRFDLVCRLLLEKKKYIYLFFH